MSAPPRRADLFASQSLEAPGVKKKAKQPKQKSYITYKDQTRRLEITFTPVTMQLRYKIWSRSSLPPSWHFFPPVIPTQLLKLHAPEREVCARGRSSLQVLRVEHKPQFKNADFFFVDFPAFWYISQRNFCRDPFLIRIDQETDKR